MSDLTLGISDCASYADAVRASDVLVDEELACVSGLDLEYLLAASAEGDEAATGCIVLAAELVEQRELVAVLVTARDELLAELAEARSQVADLCATIERAADAAWTDGLLATPADGADLAEAS